MNNDFEGIERERLPTLYEVLIQRTSSPVDLWTFYTYLSQFPYAVNYLDFWIDLMAHTRLCKDYINIVRRSLSDIDNEYENANANGNENENESAQSVTTSVLMNRLMESDKPENNPYGNTNGNKVSRWLEEWGKNEGLNISDNNLPRLMDAFIQSRDHSGQNGPPYISSKQLLSNAMHLVRTYIESDKTSERYLTNIPDSLRQELIDSVICNQGYDPEIFHEIKDITYQFLEIDCFPKFLSQVALHNLHDEISDWRFHKGGCSRDGPLNEDNHSRHHHHHQNKQKKYPRGEYTGSKSPFSNFTKLSRIAVGFIWLWIGFWIGYTLIFLNYSRAIRVTTVVPFLFGVYYIISGLYQVDIIYSCFGITQRIMYNNKSDDRNDYIPEINGKEDERVPWIFYFLGGRNRLIPIKHPFIKQLLIRRGCWCALIVFIWTTCFTVIFSCVPGKRL